MHLTFLQYEKMPDPTVYKRTSAAPKQVKFPARRHNTRSGASRAVPQKLKRQSTLTQLDFVSTPHSADQVISVSSDEDEEYAAPKPKKRRKMGKKSRDQSTLTQNWRRVVRDSEEESGGELGEWEEEASTMESPHASKAQDTQGAASYFYGRVLEVSSEMQEPVEDGDSVASPAFMQHRMLVASSNPGDGSTRPSTAESRANPRTPKTARRTEVPSSQTPSSAILSVRHSRTNREFGVSPLKERSCTPTPLKKSPRSQTSSPSKRILKHMESDIHKMYDPAFDHEPAEPWKAETISSPRQKHPPTPVERRLMRTTTVQDSQEDLAVDAPTDPKVERRSLKRTSTVLDSEDEPDLDEMDVDNDNDNDDGEDGDEDNTVLPVEPEIATKLDPHKPKHPGMDMDRVETQIPQASQTHVEDHQTDEEMYFDAEEGEHSHVSNYPASPHQQTFDPVNAALDRDAARFGHGPTQLATQHHSYAGFGDLEDQIDFQSYEHREEGDDAEMHPDNLADEYEERVEDSQPEFVADSPVAGVDPETQFVADSPPAELQYDPSPELGIRTQAPVNARNGGSARAPVEGDYMQSMVAVSGAEDIELPMPTSSRLPRPSQVSTVVSTQRTASRPSSRHGNTPTSPQKSAAWENTFSSSPFPMPPESWRGAQSYKDLETQSSGILDFSLPPPPPLLSSSKQTPASSSR